MPELAPVWLRRLTWLTAFSTLFLIFAGAMVTSTGSGLAVPDWPLSYGMVFPPMVGGIFYEHGHRMVATAVGFLTLCQAFWLQKREPSRLVRRLGWVALGMVIVQGLLGGLTVKFLLPLPVSVSHAALAELFLCLTFVIAFLASPASHEVRESRPAFDLRGVTTLVALLHFLQIVIGAVMRHLGAGLAIPDFPLSFGRVVPELATGAITVNFMHRAGALLITAAIVFGLIRVLRGGTRQLARTYLLLAALLPLQVTLAAFTIWSGQQPIVTSLHVVTGAAMFATATLAMVMARSARPAAERVEPSLQEVTA